jgi:hypothetical protein
MWTNLKDNQNQNQLHLVGKKVSINVDGFDWVGNLTFSGVNPMLNNQLQVTIDKTPLKVTQSQMDSIKLVGTRTSLFS